MRPNHILTPICLLSVFSVGLIGFSRILSDRLVTLFLDQYPNPVSLYLRDFFWNSHKPFELTQYCLTISLLSIFACISSLALSRPKSQESLNNFISNASVRAKTLYWSAAIATNALIIAICTFVPNGNYLINIAFIFFLSWIILLAFPFNWTQWSEGFPPKLIMRFISEDVRGYRWFCIVSLVTTTLVLLWMLAPFIFGQPKLMDEFWSVSSSTVLQKSPDMLADSNADASSPAIVNDLDFIKTHSLLGPDPVTIGAYVDIAETPTIHSLCDKSSAVAYDENLHRLCFLEPMKPAELNEFTNAMGTLDQRVALQQAETAQEAYWQSASLKMYTPQEKEFLQRNRDEIHVKTLNRFIVHHHNFILAPMNDLALGRPASQSYFQYGYFNCKAISWICRMISGDISWQVYFPVLYFFYLVYFIMVVIAAWSFFQRISLTSLMALGCVASMGLIGYRLTLVGPGVNPLRHLLDIPVAFMIWKSLNTVGRRKWEWFIVAYLFSLIEILASHEFGIFLSFAAVMIFLWSLATDVTTEKKFLKISLTTVMALLGQGLACCVGSIGASGQGKYYLLGLLGFPIREGVLIIICIFCGFFLISGLLLSLRPSSRIAGMMALFMGSYAMQLDTYFIWNYIPDHLLSLAVIHEFAVIFLFKAFMQAVDVPSLLLAGFRATVIFGAMLTALFSVENFAAEKIHYDKDFYSHVVYHWNFDRARILSTMDPAPLAQSIDLIKANSGANPAIYLISRYDLLLPFLAHKYSNMPYFEIGNFMVTSKEEMEVLYDLQKDKPQTIFVDSDISRNCRMEIIPAINPLFGYLHNESFWRAERLEMLRQVWDEIKKDYVLKTSGDMISVWTRKS